MANLIHMLMPIVLVTIQSQQGHAKLQYRAVTAGATHTCGITATGAYCWGDNAYGQLGTGHEQSSSVPVAVTGGVTFASVSAGDGFTCGVSTSGDGYCWGRTPYGQSESGRPLHTDTPTPVPGQHHFMQVSAGANHACGVTTERAVYCWGVNTSGQLGSGDAISSPVPRPVATRAPFASVSASWDHTCGVAIDGTAYCWGNNRFGQLGDGSTTASLVPRPVEHIRDFVSVSAGGRHTCGVTARGVGYCWGDNLDSQIGTGPDFDLGFGGLEGTFRHGTSAYWVPAALASGHRLAAVLAGGLHTCTLVLESIDRVGCRGSNRDVLLSTEFFSGIEFVQLDAGDFHTCGATEDGTAYCWGRNEAGELGDGTFRVPTRPARVVEPDSAGR